MSIEARLAALEKQVKRIQIIQNENAQLKQKVKDLEGKLASKAEKRDLNKEGFKQLDRQQKQMRIDLNEIAKEPKQRIARFDFQDDQIKFLRESMNLLKYHTDQKVKHIESRVTDFRGKYVPMLENFVAHRTLRSRRNR